jgi:hypothetical protein
MGMMMAGVSRAALQQIVRFADEGVIARLVLQPRIVLLEHFKVLCRVVRHALSEL